MPHYRLHYFPESGNSYKLALMLRLCGQSFEPVWTDFAAGVTRTPEWRASVNAMGEIPVLEEDGVKLTQTAPLLLQLAERYGRFGGDTAAAVRISWPSDARRLASVKVSPEVPTDEPVSRIDVAAGDTILFEGRPVDLVGLRMELDWLSVREQFWLELRPHPESRHERVHEVLGVIGRAGPFYMRIDHRPFRSAIG